MSPDHMSPAIWMLIIFSVPAFWFFRAFFRSFRLIRALRLGFSWFGLAFVAAIVPRDCREGLFIYSALRAMANTANEKQAGWLADLRSKQ